ncbi:hypothetical protein ACQCQZ_26155, partial [Ralstonia pseudosolanacearum]|uniref:hypothetical protein n=1 Tax=Ralstonia pseudosolanacearum TaxID=1310165 RepID=UPI003CF43ADE
MRRTRLRPRWPRDTAEPSAFGFPNAALAAVQETEHGRRPGLVLERTQEMWRKSIVTRGVRFA